MKTPEWTTRYTKAQDSAAKPRPMTSMSVLESWAFNLKRWHHEDYIWSKIERILNFSGAV
jgi:hypothetical protein